MMDRAARHPKTAKALAKGDAVFAGYKGSSEVQDRSGSGRTRRD